ncbi:MAG: DUF3416 domain-containing protein [Bifidobacteriaceae bacterium]|jgi:starch synthase (maltosyl-transferring)|nr:DUF3416 domain-containing protein [Bifidobacteriaceae bacterium]
MNSSPSSAVDSFISKNGLWSKKIIIRSVHPYINDYVTVKVGVGEIFEVSASIFQEGREPITASVTFENESGETFTKDMNLINEGHAKYGCFVSLNLRGKWSFYIKAQYTNAYKVVGSQVNTVYSDSFFVYANSKLSRKSEWYQIFPRSIGAKQDENGNWISGTFKNVESLLPKIKDMGFSVLYLGPVNPVGQTKRKGKDNSLNAKPSDPGSPWAIGSNGKGHYDLNDELGTMEDFKSLVQAARKLDIEISIDLALQCSPDHPWLEKHPEWFNIRADGTIAYAENPPKKYEDIYPLSFKNDPFGLCNEIIKIIKYWHKAGINFFRVDNPHTKPLWAWEYILKSISNWNPNILFLAEAFTKYPIMKAHSETGFHLSHCYFPWKNTKEELAPYIEQTVGKDGYSLKPTFWPTTPDIMTPYLADGGVMAHKIRAVLAALGSTSWGIYGGYELVETNINDLGTELSNNEKYEFKSRDLQNGDKYGLQTLFKKLNEIRNLDYFATMHSVVIPKTDNDDVLVILRSIPGEFAKSGKPECLVAAVNMNYKSKKSSKIKLFKRGFNDFKKVKKQKTCDLLTGEEFEYTPEKVFTLDPKKQVAKVFTIVGE